MNKLPIVNQSDSVDYFFSTTGLWADFQTLFHVHFVGYIVLRRLLFTCNLYLLDNWFVQLIPVISMYTTANVDNSTML